MTYQDRNLTCVECNSEFAFTAGEQEFFAGKGYLNDPKRCPDCRTARRSRDSYSAGPRQMYPAVCAQCGVDTEVPFLPREDRPVYCSACFAEIRGSSSAGYR